MQQPSKFCFEGLGLPRTEEDDGPEVCFKNMHFSYCEGGSKKYIFKSLKQVLAFEKTQGLPEEVTYSAMNAPPSLLPPKKYSDISGLSAPYTDPQTKLRYHSAEEYAIVKQLPSDITAGYLNLRGASSIVG